MHVCIYGFAYAHTYSTSSVLAYIHLCMGSKRIHPCSTYIHTYSAYITNTCTYKAFLLCAVHPAVYYYMKRHRLFGFSTSYLASIAQPWSFLAAAGATDRPYWLDTVCMYVWKEGNVCMYDRY